MGFFDLIKQNPELLKNSIFIPQKNDLSEKISDDENLSSTGKQKILDAIKNQRWFFFENNSKIIFDRDTALIWANLEFFPYKKSGDTYYSRDVYYLEVKNLIEKVNKEKFGWCSNWRIPTVDEFEKMFADKTFPFCDKERIKSNSSWCVSLNSPSIYNGVNLASNKTLRNSISDFNVAILPCNFSLRPQNFSYLPENILKIFSQTKLIPKFNDNSITQLYKEIFIDKKNVEDLKNQLADVKNNEPKLCEKIDYKILLKKYDVVEIKKSPIKYFKSVLIMIDELLGILDEYEKSQSETIGELSKISLKLSAKYIDNPHLTQEENNLLAERQKFLSQRLALGTDDAKFQILSVKEQAKNFFERLTKVNHEKNSVVFLAELESEKRASFEFLTENLAEIINVAQEKMNFFIQHKNFVAKIINSLFLWSEDYKIFKTKNFEELKNICDEDGIEEEVYKNWYEDWQKKRLLIEGIYLPLVEFSLCGNLLNSAAIETLEFLNNYKKEIDKFYLNERKNIYQKFVFHSGGELQEKFETESELYKLTEKFQRNLQKIIFSRDKTEERIFLLQWADPIINLQIKEIIEFVSDKKLDAISEEVLTQFSELKKQNFSAYLADSQIYSEAIQKREKEYNALMFRMRKDLPRN